MKNLLRLSKLTFLLLIGLSVQSCSDDDDNVTTPPGPSNIVEIAMDTPDLSKKVSFDNLSKFFIYIIFCLTIHQIKNLLNVTFVIIC